MIENAGFKLKEKTRLFKRRGGETLFAVKHEVLDPDGKKRDTNYEILYWQRKYLHTLPYDPRTDKVLLLLESTPAPLWHNEGPWVLSTPSCRLRPGTYILENGHKSVETYTRCESYWSHAVGFSYPAPATLSIRNTLRIRSISSSENKDPYSFSLYGLCRAYSPEEALRLLNAKDAPPMDASARILLSWFLLHRREFPGSLTPETNPPSPVDGRPLFKISSAGKILENTQVYKGKHTLYDVRFSLVAGMPTERTSSILDPGAKAVFVLPYDPEANKIGWIREFKPVPTGFHQDPFVLSTVAGTLKPGESVEQGAIREPAEEMGKEIEKEDLHFLGSTYSEPSVFGAKSYLFVAKTSFSRFDNGSVYGNAAENERTKVCVGSPEELFANIKRKGSSVHAVSYALFLQFMLNKKDLDREWCSRAKTTQTQGASIRCLPEAADR
jgi:8-oxo-dGTP pyrophosphatase MutT (NUDIX family)